ncbi:zinc finger protein CO3 isoform X2 [Rosa rugosa]|uniref:zinc finger protein CO3 isoform X2 n=1 Tax=Rosa rugosa TaxID=74645 RepID=UPI002B40DF2C|nr:zinc finger protein CO3 isoform X2 [Rosa rugosa]
MQTHPVVPVLYGPLPFCFKYPPSLLHYIHSSQTFPQLPKFSTDFPTRAMYGHNGNAYPRANDFEGRPMPALPFGTYNNDYHHLGAAANEFSNNSCSSGCSSYGGSPTYASTTTTTTIHDHEVEPSLMIQRSVSSHSLQKNVGTHRLVSDLLELETGPVRRVYSTGDLDLQQLHSSYRSSSESSPLSSESSMIIEGMSKACRYSPEEKKERIERYRSKRNLRNFNKTIKYACRKTLADSRPRIRGRFARNDEIDQKNSPNVQWSQMSGEEDEEDGDGWINLLDAFSSIESNSLI